MSEFDNGYAVVVMHPPEKGADRLDFSSKETPTVAEVLAAVREVLTDYPDAWRLVQIVHIEDLPMVMEQPGDPTD